MLILADIFLGELGRTIMPSLSDKVKLWKRYRDDTIVFVKTGAIKNVILNSYQCNIQFIMEIKQNNQILFSDVPLTFNLETVSTTAYRKVTDTDICINLKSFALNN